MKHTARLDLQWMELLNSTARGSGLSYTELKAMDIYDFFMLMLSRQKEENK